MYGALFMADKDVDEMLALLLPLAGQFVTVAAHTPRAMPAETLAEQIRARATPASMVGAGSALPPRARISSMLLAVFS